MILRLLLLLGPVSCLLAGAEKRALEFRDVIELNEPSQPRISPDGARVVFVLSHASVEANSTRRSLWVASAGTVGRVVLDEPVVGAVEWASDGASVIVRLARPGKAAFWRVSVSDGTAAPLFEHENPILSAWWSPDRSQVLFTSAPGISAEERQRPAREGVLYDESVHGIRSFTRGSWAGPVKPGLWRWRKGMRSPEPVVTASNSTGKEKPRLRETDPGFTSAVWRWTAAGMFLPSTTTGHGLRCSASRGPADPKRMSTGARNISRPFTFRETGSLPRVSHSLSPARPKSPF
jgi:dipeptidyl aminopeptidase/acylaminoacyl peptidase